MRSSKTASVFVLAFASASYAAVSACGSNTFSTSSDAGPSSVNGGNCDTTLTPADNACVVDESVGVFVSSTGDATGADGTRAHPFATMQAGIAAAKSQKKRVYACVGDYKEQVTLVDGVSMFGDLDCKQNWIVVNEHANIAPSSTPAVIANQIQSATRVDSIDVTGPNGTAAAPSSIALLVTSSPGLTVANSTLLAGNGLDGVDGTPGIQLVQSGSINGVTNPASSTCTPTSMTALGHCPDNSSSGGLSICSFPDGGLAEDGGLNGIGGGSGGTGGACYAGGLCGSNPPIPCCLDVAHDPGTGNPPSAGVAGQSGADGVSGTNAIPGVLSANGYAPANGLPGMNGSPGNGGTGTAGGAGPAVEGEAASGMGGGAGGCPGLAGTAGTGGGASVAVLTSDGAATFDTCIIQSSNGGNAGKGTFGSTPTAGGNGAGGGGAAGWSGNGSAGPSYGVASHGAAVVLKNTTPLVGAGGRGADVQTSGAETIPATPTGAAAATVTF